MPVAGTIVGAKETVTLSSIGAFTPVIKSYYFQLYGGSKNNNDQIVQDWKSAQVAAFKKANVLFNIDAGYNIDGYVLHGVASIQTDPIAADELMLRV